MGGGWRPPVRPGNRILWSWLGRGWARLREALAFVQIAKPPGGAFVALVLATVPAWQRQRADRESRLRELVKGLIKTAGLTAADFA